MTIVHELGHMVDVGKLSATMMNELGHDLAVYKHSYRRRLTP
jgi:hypothetical protein